MDRDELILRERIQRLLQSYTLEEILTTADLTEEDVLVILYHQGIEFPEEPL